MQIDAVRETVSVQLGATFGGADAMALEEAVAAVGPFGRLEIDFAGVRDCDDAALARLASALMSLERGQVSLRGLTARQWRLLTYLGVARAD